MFGKRRPGQIRLKVVRLLEFSIVLTARATGGQPTRSNESSEVRWVLRDDLDSYSMDRSMRLRVGHFHAGRVRPYLG